MGRGRCPAHVTDQRVTDMGTARIRPQRGHRHVGMAAHGKIVSQHRALVLQRLAIDDEAVLVGDIGDRAIVVIGQQFGQRIAPVVEEALGLRLRTNDDAGQRR